MSRDQFTVDGPLIDAAATFKGFKPKEENDHNETPAGGRSKVEVSPHGQKRSNKRCQSTTVPKTRLAHKSKDKEAKLRYAGHILTENRHGLILSVEVALTSDTTGREAALDLMDRQKPS